MSTFFRFPLSALSAFDSPLERLNLIVRYCVVDVGRKVLPYRTVPEPGLVWKLGCEKLNVTYHSEGHEAGHLDHARVVEACGSGPQATVSIRSTWLFNCLYGLRGAEEELPLSYREFSVLCAILSKLGDKHLESCTWQEIRRRSLGYPTEVALNAGLKRRSDGATALSRQQIRSTLDNLTRNRFFARHAVGNGKKAWLTYYSVKMKEEELEEGATYAWTKRHRRGPLVLTPAKKERTAAVWARRHKLPPVPIIR